MLCPAQARPPGTAARLTLDVVAEKQGNRDHVTAPPTTFTHP